MSRLNNIYRREPDTDKNICTKVKKKKIRREDIYFNLASCHFFLTLRCLAYYRVTDDILFSQAVQSFLLWNRGL